MLARNSFSSAIMVDVDYLNFGKLISGTEGFGSAPQGLGVTSRSAGLRPEHDGDLRLNTLLEAQVFSPSMIDPKMADKGLLLIRTLPATPATPRGRTVFVRARFRHEGSMGVDSRPHQQASIWVVGAENWYRHSARILAKVSSELDAEPDRADNNERFGVPPKTVSLEAKGLTGKEISNERWRYAYYCILDLLLQPKLSDIKPREGEVTFGADIFEREADFLAVVGAALTELPSWYDRWNDIRICSGLRSSSGLSIRYLPSEPRTTAIDIRPRIDSIKSRVADLNMRGATRTTLGAIAASRPATAPVAPAVPNPVRSIIADAERSLQASQPARPAGSDRPVPGLDPRGMAEQFRSDLRSYRDAPCDATAQRLVKAAIQAQNIHAREMLKTSEDHVTLDAICSTLEAPLRPLPIGSLYDRMVLVSLLPPAAPVEQWRAAFWSAVARLGVLLPAERERLHRLPQNRNEELRHELNRTYKNSQELSDWLRYVGTGAGARGLSVPDPSFLESLRQRLKHLLDGLGLADEKGINKKVIVGGNFILDRQQLLEAHGLLMHGLATNLINLINEQNVSAQSRLRTDLSREF
ncbi:hypothetical protein [Bradyrhizobium aeschynomenes]|uniref:hypothetical protein n=1 Tax=Bradyrhizobium aeschynomenes TaxID=2734909 RepID=UPI0015527445|nr:hypothetical protein [Bradyrhizobium aeschynomenes]NPV19286.1 hypothetical protein [Bradyrhizobium aeschynomenes]